MMSQGEEILSRWQRISILHSLPRRAPLSTTGKLSALRGCCHNRTPAWVRCGGGNKSMEKMGRRRRGAAYPGQSAPRVPLGCFLVEEDLLLQRGEVGEVAWKIAWMTREPLGPEHRQDSDLR